MSRVRCESIEDLTSGKFYLELYYPVDAEKAFLTSIPLYRSHEEAEHAAVAMFQNNMPAESIDVEYGPFPELFPVPALEVLAPEIAPASAPIAADAMPRPAMSARVVGGRPSLLQRFFSQI
jgi:hypothetical protein